MLTKDIEREAMQNGAMYRVPILLTGGSVYYKGGIINVTAAGLGVKAADTAGQRFLGVLEEQIDASDGNLEGTVIRDDKMWIPFASAAQSNVGDLVYATDDDTIALTATNVPACGQVVDVRVGEAVLVDFAKAQAA